MDQFRYAYPGLHSDHEEQTIAAADPRLHVWCNQERVDLLTAEKGNRATLVALGRNREDPTTMIELSGLVERDVVDEGMNGGEAHVACPGRVAAVVLDVIEKRADKRRIERIERESRWRRAEMHLREVQQEAEGVPVRSDRMGARPSLPEQAVGEERLNKCANEAERVAVS